MLAGMLFKKYSDYIFFVFFIFFALKEFLAIRQGTADGLSWPMLLFSIVMCILIAARIVVQRSGPEA